MTRQEAISYLKNLYGDGSCEYVIQPLKTEVVGMAIRALIKQIPCRPEGEYPYFCPSCRRKLIPCRYCPECGRAIDWSKKDDD